MNYQVRDAHWPLRLIWTRTSMISTFVFDAALRAVSLALVLPFLLPGSLVTSLPGKFTEPLLWIKVYQSYQSIMVVAGWIPNRKHEAQALFRERARLSIQYFALQI